METLIYLGKSAVILSLFYITYVLILCQYTFFTAHRHFLLGGILLAFGLPLMTITRTTYIDLPEVTTTLLNTPSDFTPIVETVSNPSLSIDWWQLLFIIYISGVLFMLLRLCVQLFSLQQLIRKHPVTLTNGFRHVKVFTQRIAPFSFFKHIVYNPQLHQANELDMIITHEQVHARQWHTLDMLCTHLLLAIQWINPVAWWYRKSLEQNLEFIADSETAYQVNSLKDYQMVLVKCSSAQIPPALTNPFYHSLIKKRIVMLNKQASKRHHLLKIGVILPLLAFFLYSFNVIEVVEYRQVSQASQSANTQTNSETDKAFAKQISVETTAQASDQIEDVSEENQALQQSQQRDNYSTVNTSQVNNNIRNRQTANLAMANTQIAQIGSNVSEIQQSQAQQTANDKLYAQVFSPNAYSFHNESAGRVIATFDPFKFTITKNTSDDELDKLKAELKQEYGIQINYNIKRNSTGEITSISFDYKDGGNSGQMNISDDGPIEDIVFYRNEDGTTGFGSATSERHAEEREYRMQERVLHMEERARQMHERVEERVEERAARHKERAEALQERHKARVKERIKMREEHIEKEKELRRRHKEHLEDEEREIREHVEKIRKEHGEHNEEAEVHIREMKERIEGHQSDISAHQAALAKRLHHASGDDVEVFSMTKHTTQEELKGISALFKEKGISLNISKVKRNAKGEITAYKISYKDDKGNASESRVKSDTPIPPTWITYADGKVSIN